MNGLNGGSSSRRSREMADINVTSLVDVSLVLLIVFMLTAPFIQAGVEIDLPQAADAGLDVREGMVLSIGPDRTVWIGDDLCEQPVVDGRHGPERGHARR